MLCNNASQNRHNNKHSSFLWVCGRPRWLCSWSCFDWFGFSLGGFKFSSLGFQKPLGLVAPCQITGAQKPSALKTPVEVRSTNISLSKVNHTVKANIQGAGTYQSTFSGRERNGICWISTRSQKFYSSFTYVLCLAPSTGVLLMLKQPQTWTLPISVHRKASHE